MEGTLTDSNVHSLTSTLASQPLSLGPVHSPQPGDVVAHLQPAGTLPGAVPVPIASPVPSPVPVPVPGAVPVPVPGTVPGAVPQEASPAKRRPGRPKGSGKKAIDLSTEPKTKRPVGRPRKDGLPAGSVGPKKPGRTRKRAPGTFASGASMQMTYSQQQQQPPPFLDPSQWASISAPAAPIRAPPSVSFPIDPSLDSDNWTELARHRPDAFLHALVSALSAPNPISAAGVSVEDAFRAHLASLTPDKKAPNAPSIPALYSILKTFWLPSSPAYFSLTASASTSRSTPSEHRFLYWDPQPLVFNGIACPACAGPLLNKGSIASGPIKVYDLGKPFFVIGCEYVCKSPMCAPPGTPTAGEGRRFASTDASIMRALPAKLKDEFPARLIQGAGSAPDMGPTASVWSWRGMGVSVALWDMARAALRAGMYKDVILGIIHSVTQGLPDEPWAMQAGLLEGEKSEEEDADDAMDAAGENDTNGAAEGDEANIGGQVDKEGQTAEEFQAWTNHNNPPEAATNGMPEAGPSNPNSIHAVPAMPPPPPADFTNPFAPAFLPYGYPPTGFYPPPGVPPPPPTPNMMKRTFALVEGGEEPTPRRVRHCVKCGSSDCKGKGGRTFCVNACQDCGKMDCKGRNSKRPDRTCTDAWTSAEVAAAAVAA